MNTPPPRCSVPGSTCRLLQLELPDPRPVWAALDAAGARRFTGELTLHLDPIVRVWFLNGEVYLAERETDAPLADRLQAAGVVGGADIEAGTVHVAGTNHLGRLFDRVPGIDRDAVELTVELQAGEILGQIADRIVPSVETASYRHHPSGIHRWWQRPAADTARATTVAPSTISASMIDEVAALAARAAEQAAALPALRSRRSDGFDTGPHPVIAVEQPTRRPQPADEFEELRMAFSTDVAEPLHPVELAAVVEVEAVLGAPLGNDEIATVIEPAEDVEAEFVEPPEVVESALFAETVEFVEFVETVEFAETVEFVESADVAETVESELAEYVEFAATVAFVEPFVFPDEAEALEPFDVPDEVEVLDALDVAADVESDAAGESDSSGSINLAQIIREVTGVGDEEPGSEFAQPGEPIDISEDVRAAVRLALAEIQAATRPPATDGFSLARLLETEPTDAV